MFSSVESCRTKRANSRLVASSIMAIRYSFSPRPSSQSCSLVSHCTSSPKRLRRGRQQCTCLTFSLLARHSLPRIIHCRTVSLLASIPCFLSRYSAAKVGPNPSYTGADNIFTAGQADQRASEMGFAGVISHAHHQRIPDLRLGGEIVFGDGARAEVQIHHHQILFESSGAREHAAGAIESATAAVEEEVVVATNLVYRYQRQAVPPRHVAEHVLAEELLTHPERRGRKIQDGLRARSYQRLDGVPLIAAALPEIAIVPNVFTDADAEAAAMPIENLRAGRRFEVPVFVKDVVSGQQGLVEGRPDPAVLQQHRAVEQRAAAIGVVGRSEERHAGKERRSRRAPDPETT